MLVKRDAQHPMTQLPGFDLMEIKTHSAEDLEAALDEAEGKFWQVWVSGFKASSGIGGALLYKPCDIAEPWTDTPDQPHPGCIRQTPGTALQK